MATYNLTAGSVAVSQLLTSGITSFTLTNNGSVAIAYALGNAGLSANGRSPRLAAHSSISVSVPLGVTRISMIAIGLGQACQVTIIEDAIDPLLPISPGYQSSIKPALRVSADKLMDQPSWSTKTQLLSSGAATPSVPNSACPSPYWPWVIRATDHIANPVDKYYMYFSTDHGSGGIWLATAPSPLGPWKLYSQNYIYIDNSGGGESETPSVVWDRVNSCYVMLYQQIGVGKGVQSTAQAYSADGINWTKDQYFLIDIPYITTQVGDGHTGYFLPFETRRGLFAYSLYGGTNSYGNVLWKSNGSLRGDFSRGVNANFWTSDRKHLGYGLDFLYSGVLANKYMAWNHSFVVESQGTEYWVGMLSNIASGNTARDGVIAVAPIAANYRTLLEIPKVICSPTEPWESGNIRAVCPFVEDGILYIFYSIATTAATPVFSIGVISHAL